MDLNFLIDTVNRLVSDKLKVNKKITDNDLVESVDTIMKMVSSISVENRESILNTVRQNFAVLIERHQILTDSDNKVEPWIKDAKAKIKWDFWDRYRNYMNKKLPPRVLLELDDLTDDILDCIENPAISESFDRRGMVVGQVQSGKTGNYIGTICKAADAGYRVIIVLAGLHNNLRSQTQLRIDEGFLGQDTKTSRSLRNNHNYIGVGNLNPNIHAHALTTANPSGDFNKSAAESSGISIGGKDPVILVIKKNGAILRNLLAWLASKGTTNDKGNKVIHKIPLLLIDDEADNASINISQYEVSTINGCVRALLNLFERSAYIGYTATPYANIFINHDDKDTNEKGIKAREISFPVGGDIFPRDFIINIPPPSNYIGANKIFRIDLNNFEENSPWVQLYEEIDDYGNHIPDKHKNNGELPDDIPDSMKKAIRCFLLVCAVRRVRGQQQEHNSMLIHVSRFNTWQNKITELVEGYRKSQVDAIVMNGSKILKELEQLWNSEFVPITEEIIENKFIDDNKINIVTWEQVKRVLNEATQKIQVRAVHGNTKAQLEAKLLQPLDYDDYKNTGLSVICIGGDKLSRGLTLEGLSISYYLRASKFYDTLLQMGRWFGYRPGYGDLCRLFTTSDLVESYRHIALASEELRQDFEFMSANKMRPIDFGLKVQTDPDINLSITAANKLSITAANKLRHGKDMKLSFSGELEETYSFQIERESFENNFDALKSLVASLGVPTGSPNNENRTFKDHFVWSGINNYATVTSFILKIQGLYQVSFITKLLADYIGTEADNGRIKDWTIAIINKTTAPSVNLHGFDIGMTKRSRYRDSKKPKPHIYEINKSHIISPEHEYIDLTFSEIEEARRLTNKMLIDDNKIITGSERLNTKSIRKARNSKRALLLIYLLDYEVLEREDIKIPVVGLAISFPEGLEGKDYKINTVYQEYLKRDKPFDADEEDDDIELSINSMEKWVNRIKNVGKIANDIHIENHLQGASLSSNHFVSDYEFMPITSNIELIGKQIAIKSNLNAGYLQLWLNSPLLRFYIESTAEESIITQDLINKLPIMQPADTMIFERLADYINFLKAEKTPVQRNQLSFFERIANALILELYFPTDFSDNNIHLLQNLNENDIPAITGLSTDEVANTIKNVYKKITTNSHLFNKSFFYIGSLEVSKTFL